MSFESGPSEAEMRAAKTLGLEKMGLPADLYERSPEEQLGVINERMADEMDRALNDLIRNEGTLGPEVKRFLDKVRALSMERFRVKEKQ